MTTEQNNAVEGTETEEELVEEHDKYVKMWDNGEFCWNKNINQPINPERIWQVYIVPKLQSTRADERKKLVEVVKGIKDELVYPPVPKGKKMTEDFMYVRGKAVALEDVLAKISQV